MGTSAIAGANSLIAQPFGEAPLTGPSVCFRLTALPFVLAPELLMRPLTSDPQVIAHAARHLRVIGYFEIFLGWELMFEGVFIGLGHTRDDMLIAVPPTVARWPAAWLLAPQEPRPAPQQ